MVSNCSISARSLPARPSWPGTPREGGLPRPCRDRQRARRVGSTVTCWSAGGPPLERPFSGGGVGAGGPHVTLWVRGGPPVKMAFRGGDVGVVAPEADEHVALTDRPPVGRVV